MVMNRLVNDDSILLEIWGTTDITLFIFAGASAEFALNKQVDWLFYTGKLPADPIGRLFSTVSYAQQIIFSHRDKAHHAIGKINAIHGSVEASRGRQIPPEAYKDVLYLLIHYSISAYELLKRKLTTEEKDQIVRLFGIIGQHMRLTNMSSTYEEWKSSYETHLETNLVLSSHTLELFKQYRKHLGLFRYFLLREIQKELVSKKVGGLLNYKRSVPVRMALPVYRILRRTRLQDTLVRLLIPDRFKPEIDKMIQRNANG
ncbi:oxygenase MpaB family protein [Pollutibacter soli]|uniref:oxygenase MpaB family protein n=1 Tax=Pollutibacter soli TaxID=3034157 RepID=UPI003013D422